ncbi:hypothetical protein [Mycoplasma anserisalpingitidis]|uniref:Uncharacterized protein n=1 Tax=Mycoplasma anserisalpingitidis TaxID=519450 RepID=A0A5B8JHW2_9MOLU|nr:hypothetical protein [Mycoplasma anserisalpingitidis]QDY88693.1 hypothetical protein FOY43_03485 [Mycoplasma anserisalpingitidis]
MINIIENRNTNLENDKDVTTKNHIKDFVQKIQESDYKKIIEIIQDSKILNFSFIKEETILTEDKEFVINNRLRSSKSEIEKIIRGQKMISKYVSNTYWDDLAYYNKLFVSNVIKYRNFVISTAKEFYELLIQKNEKKITEFLYNLSEFFSPLMDVEEPHIKFAGSVTTASAYLSAKVLENFVFPNLKNLFESINLSEDDVIWTLSTEIRKKENIFNVLALQEKAYSIYYNKPWYKKWISGNIVQRSLYEHIKWTRREIVDASKMYNELQLALKRAEYDKYFGVY